MLCSGLLAVLALLVVETDQFSSLPSSQFGTFDFAELESASYQVEIATAPVSELQLQESLIQEGEDEVVRVPVLSKHGQLYSCTLPPPLAETEREEEEPTAETLPNITTLLKPLGEQGCLLKTVGWWTYEYCHNMFVRQYHMEAGRLVGETKYLGFYEKETAWDQEQVTRVKGLLESFKGNMVQSLTQAFHTVLFVNGTECDITGLPRSARVEIYCKMEGVDRLVEVKEETTCNYSIVIHTPLLCQHPMLVPLGSSTPSHTLSCTPVVSQLDYEDYLLKQELIRQQKEKLKVLSSEDTADNSGGEGVPLLNTNSHQLLKQLLMSSITQLAEIAYDTSNLGTLEAADLDEIVDDDKEVGGSSRRTGGTSDPIKRSAPVVIKNKDRSLEGKSLEGEQEEEEEGSVSEKMKKMADEVKSTGKDSALESLLSNLAVTAQYIESLDGNDGGGEPSNMHRDETADGEMEGEHLEQETSHAASSNSGEDDSSVQGPLPVHSDRDGNKVRTSASGETGSRQDSGASGKSISGEGLTASEEEEEEGGLELNSKMVREIEQRLQETLAKKLDTDDVTVKIVTLPEDQLQELEGEGGEEEVVGRDREGDLTNAMSMLLDSLLSGAEEPESEDKQRQSELAAGYDQVWGREQKKQNTQKNH